MDHYICTGTCGAVISQKQHDEGLKQCGASQGCTMKGHAFTKCSHCQRCSQHVAEGTAHICPAKKV